MTITLDEDLAEVLCDLAEGRGMQTEDYVQAALTWVVTHIPEATDAIDDIIESEVMTPEEEEELREAIERGLQDMAEGRGVPLEQYEAEMAAKLNLPPKPEAQKRWEAEQREAREARWQRLLARRFPPRLLLPQDGPEVIQLDWHWRDWYD